MVPGPDLRQCDWPDGKGGKCKHWATNRLSNGFAYCLRHFLAVQELRSWLCRRKCPDLSHCKSLVPARCKYIGPKPARKHRSRWPRFTIVMRERAQGKMLV